MKRLWILFILFSVGGCASYNTEFDCKAGKGVGCKSISEVNELVDKGEIGKVKKPDIKVSNISHKPSNKCKSGEIIRLPERTARVWINSFIDDRGNYVDETYVYTVIEPGKWEER